mmetsp:Transcript_28050/g.31185  ORF Transcript_28050/g.31185 Transcript_28050/m.31185 type:complete len:346 (-) Transcript_28050:91-1128(-)
MSLFNYDGAISREEALKASSELIMDEDSDEEYDVCKEEIKSSTKRKNESEESSPRPTKKTKKTSVLTLDISSGEDDDLKNLLSSIDEIPDDDVEDDSSSSLEIITKKSAPAVRATGSHHNTRSSRNRKPVLDLLDSDDEDDVYGVDEIDDVEEVVTAVNLTLKVSQKSDSAIMKVITKNGQLPKPMVFKLRMDQKFSTVVDLSKKILGIERIPDLIVELKLDGVLTVPLNDTPSSQGIQRDEEVTIKFSLPESEDDDLILKALPQKVVVEDRIRIKILVNGKSEKKYRLGKNDTFDKLYAKLATEYKVAKSAVKLTFDGDKIGLKETPNDIDLEDDDQIDCNIKR